MKNIIRGREVSRKNTRTRHITNRRAAGPRDLPYDAAHPMYVPREHYISQLIVAEVYYHFRHSGKSRANSGTKSILGHR